MRRYLGAAAVTAALTWLAATGGAPAGAAALGTRAAPGTQLWTARLPAGGTGPFSSMALSPDGDTVFVTGESHRGGATSNDYETAAYDATTGKQRWAAKYSGPGHFEDIPVAVAVSPDGREVFVTGSAQGWGTSFDYATVAYSAATGKQLWAGRYNATAKSLDGVSAMAVSPNGATVFVTGAAEVRNGVGDFATVAYSAATGRQLWTSRYHRRGSGFDAAQSLAVGPGGATVFVTGRSQRGAVFFDYSTVAYSAATGKQLWTSRYRGSGNGNNLTSSIAVSPAGNTVYVTGWSDGRKTGNDYATVAYSAATGKQLWVSRYHGYRDGFDDASAVAASRAAVYVTGGIQGRTGFEYATVAYSAATGKQLWASLYNGYQANSIAVNRAGTTVYVTGAGGIGTLSGYATVAYRAATGKQLWASRYHAPADTEAFSVVVNPAGSMVFVTGNTDNGEADQYVTVAYHG